ncbi:phasin family protein [Roseomonas sp. BN140053]|uniref:phasin family protein n=1 Tax=Roseomonas sp. BN140053 TaxID=3391898 RepID=UPI0039EB2FE1
MANEPKVARLATENMTQVGQQVGNTLAAGAEQARSAAQTGTEQARSFVEGGMSQAAKAGEGLMKAAGEAAEFNRGNLEAVTRATQTYMTGAQDLSRQAAALMQSLTEQAIENARALSSVKSVKDFADLQTSFARQAMEKFMGETVKLQEAGFRLAEQTTAPIAQRMTLAMERVGKPLAA